MSSATWDGVSITAHYTAQVWARMDLPFARLFSTAKGRALFWATRPLISGMAGMAKMPLLDEMLVQRHLIINAILRDTRPAQVIELAAGLSPRAVAYASETGVPCIDVDLPRLVETKRKTIGEEMPPSYRIVGMDLVNTENYADALAPLDTSGNTVVITEGLLMYLQLEVKQLIFDKVARLLKTCGGGIYLAEIHHDDTLSQHQKSVRSFMNLLHVLSRTEKTEAIRDLAHGEAMLNQAGFDALHVHTPADWDARLGVPRTGYDAGLCVYEARVDTDETEASS